MSTKALQIDPANHIAVDKILWSFLRMLRPRLQEAKRLYPPDQNISDSIN